MVSKAHFYNQPERDAVMAEEHVIINKSAKVKPYKRLVYKGGSEASGGGVRIIIWTYPYNVTLYLNIYSTRLKETNSHLFL